MTTEFGEYGTRRSWFIDQNGVRTYYDGRSFTAQVRRETRKLRESSMDPRDYYEAQKRAEAYVDDRIGWHEKQYHRTNSLKGTPITKTIEQFEDAVEDAKDELRGDKLILKIFFTLGFLGIGLVLGSTFLIIANVLNGFWPCTLPVVVGAAMTTCMIGAFQGLREVTDDRRTVRAAERSKRDFETAEAARQVEEYIARQSSCEA